MRIMSLAKPVLTVKQISPVKVTPCQENIWLTKCINMHPMATVSLLNSFRTSKDFLRAYAQMVLWKFQVFLHSSISDFLFPNIYFSKILLPNIVLSLQGLWTYDRDDTNFPAFSISHCHSLLHLYWAVSHQWCICQFSGDRSNEMVKVVIAPASLLYEKCEFTTSQHLSNTFFSLPGFTLNRNIFKRESSTKPCHAFVMPWSVWLPWHQSLNYLLFWCPVVRFSLCERCDFGKLGEGCLWWRKWECRPSVTLPTWGRY